MENYVVRKMVSGIVFYRVPGETRERVWKGENARQKVPFDELEKCIYDPDTKNLFDRGYLYIEDKNCRIKLELEEEDPEMYNEKKIVLDKNQILGLLYVTEFTEFVEKMKNMSDGTLEILIETTINTPKQLTIEKSDYIRKNYHVDVEKIQREKRDEKTSKEG